MSGLPRTARALLATWLMPGSQKASLAAAAGGMGAWPLTAFLLGEGESPLRNQQAQVPQLLPPLQISKPRSPTLGTSTASLLFFPMQKHSCLPHTSSQHPWSSNIWFYRRWWEALAWSWSNSFACVTSSDLRLSWVFQGLLHHGKADAIQSHSSNYGLYLSFSSISRKV